jgi:DNA-directed RNA polymerase specialized sigma24 family protein
VVTDTSGDAASTAFQPRLGDIDTAQERTLRRRLGRWSRCDRGVSAEDFDDAYQDAWCKVLEGERKGRATRNREGALRWALSTTWLNEQRRRRRHPAVALDSAPKAALVAPPTADPLEHVELLESARYLFQAVGAITDRQWQIVLLADVFGLRPADVRSRLSLGKRTYERDHARALQTLGARLGELLEGHRDQDRGSTQASIAA